VSVNIECVTEIAAAPRRVFDISLNVDAHVASMGRSREKVVAGVLAGQLTLGQEVTWRAWHFGVPWTMTNRITALDSPRGITDEQVRGPFASFRHIHIFEPVSDEKLVGGVATRMTDQVTFSAPLGPVGGLAERTFLRRYMHHLFMMRNQFLQTALQADTGFIGD
jgi:ligand-binding SRPBCC domain-containing protein